jgi:hypothetical protein
MIFQYASNLGTLPMFWNLIPSQDRPGYTMLRNELASKVCKHRRNEMRELNYQILQTVQHYIIGTDGGNCQRAMVCGFSWSGTTLVVNVRQLRVLLSKCKSSINAMFDSLGYCRPPDTPETRAMLEDCLPLLKGNFAELRQWSVRVPKNRPQPVPQAVPQPVPQAVAQEVLEARERPDFELDGWGDRIRPSQWDERGGPHDGFLFD